MENKLFVNHASAGEIGTSVASMYRTGKKNAVKMYTITTMNIVSSMPGRWRLTYVQLSCKR
jgi:hypothetical protein